MTNIGKKIIAVVTALSVSLWLAGPALGLTAEELQAQINALLSQLQSLQSQLAVLQGGTGTGTGACAGVSFTRNLSQGMSGSDVKCLQSILNQSSDTKIASSGSGSPGNETTYFGALTKAAVVKFQEKYAADCLTPIGLTSGTGFVGAKTRAKLNTMLGVVVPGVGVGTVTLAPDNPLASTIPTSAAKVPVLKVRLTAGNQDVTVSSMTFKRTGVGSVSDWSGVYVYVDDLRVTTYGRTISSDTQTVEFPTLSISIPAGQTKTVTVRADACTSGCQAGNQSAFQLVSVSPAFTGVPITGNLMTLGAVGVSSVTIAAGTAPTDPVVGALEAPIGTFKITASGNQDVELKQVILTITGTIARANVKNLKLYYGSELLATAAGVDNYDNAVLSLTTGYSVPKSLSRTFTIKADLGGRLNETIVTKILENFDVMINDKVYGYGAVVSGAPVTAGSLTLKGGILSLADQGPLVGKVGKSSQDVVLTKIGLTASRAVEVIKLAVTLTASSNVIDGDDSAVISDLRLKDTDSGATLMTGTLSTSPVTTTGAITMTGSFNLAANATRNVAITVDIGNSSSLDNKTIVGNLSMVTYGTDQVYIRDVTTGDYLKAVDVIPATVTGDTQTITAVSLDLVLASSPISATKITGTKDVPAVGLMFSAGGGSDVTVRSIGVTVNVNTVSTFPATGTLVTRDKVSVVKLMDGATLLAQKVLNEAGTAGSNAYGWATFDGLNIPIAKNTGKVLVISIDTASNLTTQYLVAVSAATSTVDARDPNDTTISLGGTGANVVTLGAAPSRVITIDTKGTLTLAANTAATPVSANIPVGGTNDSKLGVALFAFDLSATKENVKISKFVVSETGSSDDRAFKVLYLYDGANLVPGAITTFPAGSAVTEFKNFEVIIPADGKKTLTIKADLSGIDGTAVQSGQTVNLSVASTSFDVASTIGMSSGQTITCAGGVAISGNAQSVYKTTVKVALSSDSPAGAKVPSSEQDVLHLDFINEGAYDATLKNATFTISYGIGTSGVSTSSNKTFKLYDTAGNLISSVAATGMTTGIDGAKIVFSGLTQTLAAGATTKLLLKGDTTYVVTGKSVFQSFNLAAVSDIVWNDSYADVLARSFVAPLVGGTITY